MLLVGVTANLLLLPPQVFAGEEPSFYVYRSDTLDVHVCNVVEGRHGQRVMLTEFASRAGAAYAKQHKTPTEYLVLPIIVSEIPREGLLVQVGRKTFAPVEQNGNWSRGRWYGMAVYEKHFRLADITGFRYRGASLQYESKLR